ncbi:zonular occludens toxin domain-containing protein [Citrobacter meridianamericanus]|uniref:zonular occludens toxin domain-containing protein n=1 Tax=Citrobacter meridianamericanus TaxID=2894201 RepID=UPI00351D508E
MAIYVTQGELGAGKGIFGAYIMSLYYNDGDSEVKCAANYPFYTEHLGSRSSKSITVLPCNVRSSDLNALGMGSPDAYKDKFGVLILDECASFLNSRDYRDSDRKKILEWLIHARKHHWDVYLLVQHPDMLDSQVREALIENLVILNRLDHIRIPFISSFMEMTRPKDYGINKSKKSILPHLVQARFYYKKKGQHDKPFNSLTFRAKHFYPCYDTDYKFTDGGELVGNDFIDMRSSYSLIPGVIMSGNITPVKQTEVISDSKPSEKPVKEKGCFSLIIKFSVLLVLGYLCYLIWSSYFGSDNKSSHSSESLSSSSTAVPAAGVVPATPALPVLSSKWRLSGYLVSSDTERYFILTDNAGNIRYHESDQQYKGRFTQLVIGNELVTFYSGSSGSSGNSVNQPDMAEQLNSGVSNATSSIFQQGK